MCKRQRASAGVDAKSLGGGVQSRVAPYKEEHTDTRADNGGIWHPPDTIKTTGKLCLVQAIKTKG